MLVVQGAVEIKDVAFAYPARPDVQVFRNLSLSINAGQTVALVGPSGCGKSTVIQLLQRFYDPASGSVHVDGRDIRTLSLGWYRDQVGLVSQEPTLFATSIKENIAMGKPGATDAEIESATAAANADKFIRRLPEKFGTKVQNLIAFLCLHNLPMHGFLGMRSACFTSGSHSQSTAGGRERSTVEWWPEAANCYCTSTSEESSLAASG